MERVLIIDDDDAIRRTLELHLAESRLDISSADSLAAGRRLWIQTNPDLVILDLKLPDGLGTDLLHERIQAGSQAAVVMVTGHQDMEFVIRAMKAGAFNYIHKPLDIDELDSAVAKALEQIRGRKRATSLEPPEAWKPGRIAGSSRAILDIHKQIGVASKSPVNVLITGESGTGKELIARSIHNNSCPREPFIAVNCSAIVPTLMESELFGHERGAFTGAHQRKLGKLELSKAGTLFLDEIGDMPLDLQARLLRVLQERNFERVGGNGLIPFEARVIAATNQPLAALIERGQFREDLFFRLKVVEIQIPPMRERREDIPELVSYLVGKINRELQRNVVRIPETVMDQLMRHPWMGNVRELENVLTQAVLRASGDTLSLESLSEVPHSESPGPAMKSLEAMEREHIQAVLTATQGNLGEACQLLGITRPTLRKKMKDYNLDRD
jgi:two-component system response regulator AtoC